MSQSIYSFFSNEKNLPRQPSDVDYPSQSKVQNDSSHIRALLQRLNSTSTDILASALISMDGLVIASSILIGLDEDTMGAMSAVILGLGGRVSEELKRGTLEKVVFKGADGYIVMTQVNDENVLCVITNSRAKLGFLFMECKRASEAMCNTPPIKRTQNLPFLAEAV